MQANRLFPSSIADLVVDSIDVLVAQSFDAKQIVTLLQMLIADRLDGRNDSSVEIDLVTSGPEAAGITNRDTSVVVRELFAHANEQVLVVGYAIYQGQKVFAALADRMAEKPDLHVDFFVNITRLDGDTTRSEILVSRFVERFKTKQWPHDHRLPNVYFDPRSVSDGGPIRSSLHAKCVVVDQKHLFVSSANFTEAAQQRNIEVGLHLDSKHLASKTLLHFKSLLQAGMFERAI